jgi:excisionase family DNA binding protein
MRVMSDDLLLLTVLEAARRLSISRAKLYELVASGEVASVTIGRARRIPFQACEEYVERLRHCHHLDNANGARP